MKTNKKIDKAFYIRNFIFGVEDSLVSTVGFLSGIVAGGVEKGAIILTGIVLIFVEALSMGVGSLLSEHSAEEYLARMHTPMTRSTLGGVVMFLSYFVSGFIPLFPYLFLEIKYAFWASVFLSLAALFMLGAVSGKSFGVNIFRRGVEVLILGGTTVLLGVAVGRIIGV